VTYDYDKTAATASRLLARFGAPVTVTRETAGGYDSETGTTTDPTSQVWTPIGVKLDYSQKEIDGTLIKAGDQRVYMSAEPGLDPKTGDAVTLGAEVWRVVDSRTLAPAGIAVLLDVQVRR
jgi:hypothetical protein